MAKKNEKHEHKFYETHRAPNMDYRGRVISITVFLKCDCGETATRCDPAPYYDEPLAEPKKK